MQFPREILRDNFARFSLLPTGLDVANATSGPHLFNLKICIVITVESSGGMSKRLRLFNYTHLSISRTATD